jgi:hypothetical protein
MSRVDLFKIRPARKFQASHHCFLSWQYIFPVLKRVVELVQPLSAPQLQPSGLPDQQWRFHHSRFNIASAANTQEISEWRCMAPRRFPDDDTARYCVRGTFALQLSFRHEERILWYWVDLV